MKKLLTSIIFLCALSGFAQHEFFLYQDFVGTSIFANTTDSSGYILKANLQPQLDNVLGVIAQVTDSTYTTCTFQCEKASKTGYPRFILRKNNEFVQEINYNNLSATQKGKVDDLIVNIEAQW